MIHPESIRRRRYIQKPGVSHVVAPPQVELTETPTLKGLHKGKEFPGLWNAFGVRWKESISWGGAAVAADPRLLDITPSAYVEPRPGDTGCLQPVSRSNKRKLSQEHDLLRLRRTVWKQTVPPVNGKRSLRIFAALRQMSAHF